MDWVKVLTAFLTITAIVLVVLIVVGILLKAINDDSTDPANFAVKRGEEGGGLEYHVLNIEGMTCIWVRTGCAEGGCGGLTCNWDEWRK